MKKLCCYCGVNIATTKDHIPPKSIFNKPRPSDLITVPSCNNCNNAASRIDEKFKAYLGMQVARYDEGGERLFKEGVISTVKKNTKLKKTIFQSMKPVHTVTEAGVITGSAVAVQWENEVHDTTIERIIKGLFYHHYERILPSGVNIKTYWFNKPPIGHEDKLYSNSIANGAFIYQYNVVDDFEFDSMWLFQFYGGHWAGGITSFQIPVTPDIDYRH
jgi:hypothetical protein